MHEVRNIMSGGATPLVATKRGGKRDGEASLTAIPVKRSESRATNQRCEDRRRDLVDSTTLHFRRQKLDVGVVNVSSQGAMIEADIEPRIGETLDIQFADCNRTKCIVRWVRDGRIGLEFIEETVILASLKVKEHIFGGVPAGDDSKPALRQIHTRSKRHGLTWTGTLYWTFEAYSVRLRNISATGAMLEGDCSIAAGEKIRLNLAEAGTIEGEVRWCQGGQVGVSFDEKFDLRKLAEVRPAAPVPINMSLKPQAPLPAPAAAAPRRSIWKIGR